MADRNDPGQTLYETEAEPVLIEPFSETIRMILDDGTELVFDREELLAAVAEGSWMNFGRWSRRATTSKPLR